MGPIPHSEEARPTARWPTQTDYQAALLYPHSCFADPELQRAVPSDLLPFGLPQPIAGQFANVYRMRLDCGDPVAVRLFLAPQADRERRYAALSSWLARLGDAAPPSFVRFDYQGEGFTIGGRRLPLVLMDWIPGLPLAEFVERHLHESARLLALAEQWNGLTRSLAASQIAHGDLQHGNVIVQDGPGDRLRLIDYDGVWVPSLRGSLATELGHPAYRHRDRRPDWFGPRVDRLPALVIYTSLRALAVAPDLWYRLHDGDNLIFVQDDLLDPYHGRSFTILSESRGIDREMTQLVEELKRATSSTF